MTAGTAARLYLVPAPLDFGCAEVTSLSDALPEATLRTAAGLRHWICENAKSLRAYLQRIGERPAYQRAMAKGDPDLKPMLT